MTPSIEDYRAFVLDAQRDYWCELADALQRALDGVWSMGAADSACRIVRAAQLVGPAEVGGVPWPLVRGGVYAAVLDAGEVPFTPLPEADVARWDRLMTGHGLTGEQAVQRYAATVAAIRSDRETAYIRSGGE